MSSSFQMARYPRLRDETERILTTYLREQEQLCKDHVSHESLISFFSSSISPDSTYDTN